MRGRVLVTGASGFIGRDLTHRLAAAGWDVIAAARNPSDIDQAGTVEARRLPDLAADVDWSRLVRGVSHVVHLAGIAHATAAIPESKYLAVNADAVRTLGEAARAAGVQRVVMFSSVRAQCGPVADGVVDEARPPAPVDAYGRSKLAGERHLAETLDDGRTDWCVLRPVLVYGSGVKGNMASLLRLAQSRWPLPIGALGGRRSLLGLANLHAAVEHAMLAPAASRGTFLLADPEPLTVPDIVRAMREGSGTAARIWQVPLAPVRIAAAVVGRRSAWERLSGDLIVATSALEASGWHPVETSREGIARWMGETIGVN